MLWLALVSCVPYSAKNILMDNTFKWHLKEDAWPFFKDGAIFRGRVVIICCSTGMQHVDSHATICSLRVFCQWSTVKQISPVGRYLLGLTLAMHAELSLSHSTTRCHRCNTGHRTVNTLLLRRGSLCSYTLLNCFLLHTYDIILPPTLNIWYIYMQNNPKQQITGIFCIQK